MTCTSPITRFLPLRGLSGGLTVLLCILGLSCGSASGQVGELAPVAVDDSPGAERAFAEARSQARDNPERSAALLRDLLDESGTRVIARPGHPDEFLSVRRAAIRFLRLNPGVLQSWRRSVANESETLLRDADPSVVFQRRPVTAAATEAGLRLAQRAVETRQIGRARRLLEEIEGWPDHAEQSERILILEILASIEASRRLGYASDELEGMLVELSLRSPEVAGRLEAIQDAVLDGRAGASDWVVEGRAWTELWQEPLQDSMLWRRLGLRLDGPVSERSLRSAEEQKRIGTYLSVVPALIGDLVVINEGYLLQGLDRYTGRLVWYRDFGEGRGPLLRGGLVDLNRIVVADGDAFTVLGHSFREGRDGVGALVRFDPGTGDVRWEMAPKRALADLGYRDISISGPPVVAGNRIILPLRQSNNRQETLDLVLAVDRESGERAWIRMIASSGRVRNSVGPHFSELGTYQGDIIATSATGGIARIDSTTGEILWLRRIPVPLRLVWSQSPPWLIARPVVFNDAIATISPDGRSWWLLSPDTGETLRSAPVGPGTSIGAARRLMVKPGVSGSSDDLLLGVGEDVVAISVGTESTRLWSLADILEAEGLAFGPEEAPGVRGLVVVAPDGLLVPTADGLLHFDTERGSARRILDFAEAANPAIDERSIVVAGSTAIVSAMPEREAIASLRERIRTDQESVLQPLALFELARQVGESDLAIEAMEAAVAVLEAGRDGEWRDEVMTQILDAIADESTSVQPQLLALADRTAADAYGRVRLELARGDYLRRSGRPADAVSVWSAIVSEPSLASQVVPEGDFLALAGGEAAIRRIDDVCTFDPATRDLVEDIAKREVEAAIADRASSSELVALALRHQESVAGLEVAIRAMEALRDEGRSVELLALAMVVTRTTQSVEARDLVMSTAARSLREMSRADLAVAIERDLRSERPRDLPDVRGASADFRSFANSSRVVPRSGVASASHDHLIVRTSDGSLVCSHLPTMQTLWSIAIGGQSAEILELGDRYVVGLASKTGDLGGIVIQADDGEVLQTIDDLGRFLPPRDSLSRNPDGFLPTGRPFFPFEIVMVPDGEDGLGLVRRDGDLAFLDLEDPVSVRWSRRDLMDRVNGFIVQPGVLQVFGAREVEDEVVGVVVTLDPETGAILWSAELGVGEVQWLADGPAGRLIAGTRDAVHLLDPASGMLGQARGWSRSDPRLYETFAGWLAGDGVVLIDGNGVPVALDARFGGIAPEAASLPVDPGWIPGPLVDVQEVDQGRRVLVFSDRLVLLGASGELLGADALPTRGRENLAVAVAEDGLYLLYKQVVGNSYRRRIQRFSPDRGLMIDGPSFDFEPMATVAEGLDAGDGWLLLTGLDEVQALRIGPRPAGG